MVTLVALVNTLDGNWTVTPSRVTLPPPDPTATVLVLPEPLHVWACPPLHTPVWHVSELVQALPSLQTVPFVFATAAGHPVAGTHAPIVWHWSVVHVTATAAGHPVAGTHTPIVWQWSVVHVTAVPPVHAPDWHVSPVVHALLSLHVVPFAFATAVGHPVAGTHAPIVWHWSVVHVTAVPPVHVPIGRAHV